MKMKGKNSLGKVIESKLEGKEAESFRKDIVRYQVRNLGFSSNKAETTADRALKAINQAAEEFKGISKEVKRLRFADGE